MCRYSNEVFNMTASGIHPSAVETFTQRERERFIARNPKSVALAERARHSLYGGVPMHWMADWSTPVPLFVERAKGARFYDVDGHEYIDFCLGDTGTMFGHSPDPIAKAIAEQGNNGLTTMLPGEDAVVCGELLAARFGLPFWQVTATATDSNRYVLRWARAITQRKTLLVFDGCYHGTVDDVMVRCIDGETVPRSGLVGQAYDLTEYSRSIPFNDVAALEAALAKGDVCALLCEPAMTNIGMVLPEPGFMQTCRELTRKYGALLIIDETHTISTDMGGCTKLWDLDPDFFVVGKPISKHDLQWSVPELAARSEFQFCPVSPKTGAEAEAAFHDELQMALHLYLINRGILITPFHNMTLCCPSTTADDVDKLISMLDQALTELLAIPGARE